MRSLSIYTDHMIQRQRRGAILWAISFAVYVALIMAIFPSMSETLSGNFADAYPEGLKTAFNITDMGTITGFLQAEVYSYAPLVLAFFPIMTLAAAVAGEEERGALDMMLTVPLSRTTLLLANWLSTAFWFLVILLTTGIVSWLMAVVIHVDLSFRQALSAPLAIFPLGMVLGSIALLISTLVRSKGAAVGAATGVMFLMYAVDLAGKLTPDLGWLSRLSGFHYLGSPLLDGVDEQGVIGLILAAVILLIVAIPVFRRRDIYT